MDLSLLRSRPYCEIAAPVVVVTSMRAVTGRRRFPMPRVTLTNIGESRDEFHDLADEDDLPRRQPPPPRACAPALVLTVPWIAPNLKGAHQWHPTRRGSLPCCAGHHLQLPNIAASSNAQQDPAPQGSPQRVMDWPAADC